MSLATAPALTDDELREFTENFGKRVCAAAREQNWNADTRQLVADYIKSLINGDASVPTGLLNKVVLSTIDQAFDATVRELHIPDGQLPGQRRPQPATRPHKPKGRSRRTNRQRAAHAA